MKDRAIIELIDKWLDLRFPNADSFYRAEWHHRYEKYGIEFSIHMDSESRLVWKKVYLEFLDAPTPNLVSAGHWIVAYTTTIGNSPISRDEWCVFDNEESADKYYLEVLEYDDLYTASKTKVVESTDYWEGR